MNEVIEEIQELISAGKRIPEKLLVDLIEADTAGEYHRFTDGYTCDITLPSGDQLSFRRFT